MFLTPLSHQGPSWALEEFVCMSLGQRRGRKTWAICKVRRGRAKQRSTCMAKIQGSTVSGQPSEFLVRPWDGTEGLRNPCAWEEARWFRGAWDKIHGPCRCLRRSAAARPVTSVTPEEVCLTKPTIPSGANFPCLEIQETPRNLGASLPSH